MLGSLFSGEGIDILIEIVCRLAAVIIALSLHEFAHAYVAHKCGDDTAKINGRMTVNPLKHIDPLGFIMLILLRFGFAKPVPINPYNFKKMRRDYFLVAIAGVTVNLVLAFISSFFFVIVTVYGNFNQNFTFIIWYFFLSLMAINIGLMIFNLIPIFPLDGFRVVESAAGRNNKFVSFMRKYGQYILIGLLIWSFLIDFISGVVTPEAANVLRYFNILDLLLGTLRGWIVDGFTGFWRLIFN